LRLSLLQPKNAERCAEAKASGDDFLGQNKPQEASTAYTRAILMCAANGTSRSFILFLAQHLFDLTYTLSSLRFADQLPLLYANRGLAHLMMESPEQALWDADEVVILFLHCTDKCR
jgi:hypothetical protein